MVKSPGRRGAAALAGGALALAASLTAAMGQAAIESRYSGTTGKACLSRELKQGHDVIGSESRCGGPDDYGLMILDTGNVLGIGVFAPGGAEEYLINASQVGARVEWRGRGGGVFRPFAMIIRLDYAGALLNQPAQDQVLAVISLAQGKACVAAIVDARRNLEANALARSAADLLAEVQHAGTCPKARAVGTESAAVKRLLSR